MYPHVRASVCVCARETWPVSRDMLYEGLSAAQVKNNSIVSPIFWFFELRITGIKVSTPKSSSLAPIRLKLRKLFGRHFPTVCARVCTVCVYSACTVCVRVCVSVCVLCVCLCVQGACECVQCVCLRVCVGTVCVCVYVSECVCVCRGAYLLQHRFD